MASGHGGSILTSSGGTSGWTRRATGIVDTGSDTGIGGGIMQTPPLVPPYLTFYVGVDDLDKYLRRAQELGGSTVLGPMPVGQVGAFAMFADPDGNIVGLFRERA